MERPETQKNSFLLSFVKGCIYVSALIPLFTFERFYQPFATPKTLFFLAISEIIILAFAWLLFFDPNIHVRLGLIGKAFLVFFAVISLSSLFGIDPLFSFLGDLNRAYSILIWAHLFGLFAVLISVFRTQKDWLRFFVVLVSISLLISFFHLLSKLGIIFSFVSGDGSTLGNSSFLGTYILWNIFFASLIYVLNKCVKIRTFALISVGILIGTLIITPATTAQISLVGGVIAGVSLFLFLREKKGLGKIIGISILASMFIVFVMLWIFAFKENQGMHLFLVQAFGGERFVIWKIALKAIAERPVFGWGLGNFSSAFLQFYDPCFGSQVCGYGLFYDKAHNVVLDILVQSGFIGLIAYVGMYVAFGVSLVKAFRKKVIPLIVLVVVFAAMLAYFVQNLSVFDTITSLMSWIFLLAFAQTLYNSNDSEKINVSTSDKQISAFIPVIVTLFLPIIFFFFVVQPGRAQIAARDVVMSTQMNERFTIYHDAMNLSPIGNDARKIFLSAFTSTLILDIKSEVVLKNRELFERELRLAESGLKETINSHPTFLRAYLNLGLLYQAWARIIDEKKFTDAESVLSTAIFLFPNNSLPQWQLVGVYLDQKQFQTALELADRAFALDTNVRHSYFRYLLTLKLAGQEQELHNMTEETQKVDPEFFYLIEPFLSLDISNEEVRELVITRFYYATSFLFDVNQIE